MGFAWFDRVLRFFFWVGAENKPWDAGFRFTIVGDLARKTISFAIHTSKSHIWAIKDLII